MVFEIFAAVADFEAGLIRERTLAGLKAARAKGRMSSMPRKITLTKWKMAVTAMGDQNNTAQDVAKQLGITTNTLYDYVNGDGTLKEKGHPILHSK